MFGYITPLKPELKLREMELYKSVYCGLCKQLGRSFGPFLRLFLSYDFVFFAMVLNTANEGEISISPGRCMLNPMKKRCIITQSPEIEYAAAMSILLLYYKISDDIADSRFFKSLRARIVLIFIMNSYKKCKKKYPQQDAIINKSVQDLAAIEKERADSIDEPADTFASLLAGIAEKGIKDSQKAFVVGELFRHIGRWIYIMDAFSDMDEDIKQKSYNPLFLRFSKKDEQTVWDFKKRIADDVGYTLTQSLAAVTNAFDLMPEGRFFGILNNIIRGGLYYRQENVINQKGDTTNGSV